MSLHSSTPQLRVIDPRALLAREIAWHRIHQVDEAQARVTRHVWDEAGRSVADWDPRLWESALTANSRKTPSLSGQVLLDQSVDAGWRLELSGADRQSVERWDSRGSYSRTDYDECLRPVSVTEKLSDSPPNVVERLTYGDASELFADHNQCGRLIRHDDPAGTWCAHEFGLASGILVENRRFLQTDEQPDWPVDSGQRDALLEAGEGHTTTTVFDATASLTSQTDAVGNRTGHLYTVGGLLRETRLKLTNAENIQTLISDFHYNPAGQLESERLGNGVMSEKTYEPETGRLTRILSSRADGTALQDLNYRYDPVGNVVEIEDAAQPTRFFANQRIDPVSRYRYDTLYQLIESTGREVSTGASYGPALPTLQHLPQDPNQLSNYTQSYDYDAGGNLLEMRHVGTQSFTRKMLIAPDSNRSLAEGDADPNFDQGFDANGNLQQLIRGQDLTWDLRNQLQGVSAVERRGSADDEERYLYDSSGQRCRKTQTTLTKARMLTAEVRYLPGLELRSGALSVISAQCAGHDVRVLHWQGQPPGGINNDQVRYTLHDRLGSSTMELGEQGDVISQENYYPFGGTSWWAARSAVEANFKTIRYSGKECDATGLYYYGFRYYAPWLFRWLNPDPLGSAGGLNTYRAMNNNPVTLVDPDGLRPMNPAPGSPTVKERVSTWPSPKKDDVPSVQIVPGRLAPRVVVSTPDTDQQPSTSRSAAAQQMEERHQNPNRDREEQFAQGLNYVGEKLWHSKNVRTQVAGALLIAGGTVIESRHSQSDNSLASQQGKTLPDSHLRRLSDQLTAASAEELRMAQQRGVKQARSITPRASPFGSTSSLVEQVQHLAVSDSSDWNPERRGSEPVDFWSALTSQFQPNQRRPSDAAIAVLSPVREDINGRNSRQSQSPPSSPKKVVRRLSFT